MNWYKHAQSGFGFHGTDTDALTSIKSRGLNIGTFFSSNEDDISSYTNGAWIRFPFPRNFTKRTGRGDYYTTNEIVPPTQIEYKTDLWDDYQPI